MATQTSVIIRIDGEDIIEFDNLEITQQVNGHHTFSFVEVFHKGFSENALDRMQRYIGGAVHVEITPKNFGEGDTHVFRGVVTDASLARAGGDAGGIVVSGHSPTIYMDGVPKTRNFVGESLTKIIHEATRLHTGKVRFTQNADDEQPDYIVQYKESDFNFLRRLAQKKGQWFYFNGEELVFGRPKGRQVSLEYGRTLEEFDIRISARPLGFQYTGYDAASAEVQHARSSEIGHNSQGLLQNMVETSEKMYPEGESELFYHHPLAEGNARSHLLSRVKTQAQARVSRLVLATGVSEDTRFHVGDIIGIKEPKFGLTQNPKDLVQEKYYGNYYVTSLTHHCDGKGNYSNEFTAVPDSVEVPPYTNIFTPPVAETQSAIVTDNNDPKGLGRVKVKFHWDYESPWIPMVQPHSGGNKGFYFIPEVGEEVQVAFEGGNAEKPYVTGALYNGKQSSGYATAENDFKVIHTRSGHIIKLSDAKGAESITITDKNKNIIFIDTVGNNIDITANETMTLNAKNMQINVEEDLDIQVGNNKSEIVTNDHMFRANNKDVKVNEEIKVLSTTYKQQAQEIITDTSGEIKTNAGGLITIASAEGVDYGE
ncbi:type VI secretion system Vgr family protein [Sinomicrobium sp. M5D2P9]